MIYQPEYRAYLARVWIQINKTILLLFFFTILISIIENVNVLFVLLIGILPVIVILIVRSLNIHKFYLKSIEIDEINMNVRLEVFKYNKIYQEYNLTCQEISVRIDQMFFSYRSSFHRLKVFKDGKLILKQYECEMWPLDILSNISKEIKKLKSIQVQQNQATDKFN